MLQNPPSLELLRHELRRRICEHCRWRPVHSEVFGPEVVRACELTCPIFVHLHQMQRAAVLTDPMLRSKEGVLRHLIDELCPTQSGKATSPLECYRNEVVNAILDLIGRN
jgi:hypothetical protein